MAIPVNPTATTIVTEALNKGGHLNPSAAKITRAEDFWLEEVKLDIAERKDWKILEETALLVLDEKRSRYTLPTDYEKMLSVKIYSGEETGTVQTGAASTITLDISEGITEGTAEGSLIFITSGTAKGQSSRITAYDESTKIATVSPSWGITPDNTSEYMIASTERTMQYLPHEMINRVLPNGMPSRSTVFEEELIFDKSPDRGTYVAEMRYIVDIALIDLAGTKISELYREWRVAMVQGVLFYVYDDDDDIRSDKAEARYERLVMKAMSSDGRKKRQRGQTYIKTLGGLPR